MARQSPVSAPSPRREAARKAWLAEQNRLRNTHTFAVWNMAMASKRAAS